MSAFGKERDLVFV